MLFMHEKPSLQTLLENIRLVRPPRFDLATFGTTAVDYFVVSEAEGTAPGARLRRGKVTAQKPSIVTPDLWQRRFEGFGEEQEAFGRALEGHYGSSFRALEYQFRNELEKTTDENLRASELIGNIDSTLAEDAIRGTALIHAPEAVWNLGVMKFIVEWSMRSFPSNVRELDERGFFDPEGREVARQRRHIEQLFQKAAADSAARPELAETLKRYGLFREYEDRFFGLIS
jgi:hypothetical protein